MEPILQSILTVSLGVAGRNAVVHVGNVEERGSLVSLHHHLQLAFGALNQFLSVCEGQVLRHSAINLEKEIDR